VEEGRFDDLGHPRSSAKLKATLAVTTLAVTDKAGSKAWRRALGIEERQRPTHYLPRGAGGMVERGGRGVVLLTTIFCALDGGLLRAEPSLPQDPE